MALTRGQQNFIDVSINHPNIKSAISSKYEYEFKKLLSSIGKEGQDWFHQKAYHNEDDGLIAVTDFVFIQQKLIIELDGKDHNSKYKKALDRKRDVVFYHNDFNVLRIQTPIPPDKLGYWKVYIEETLKVCEEEIAESKKPKKQYKKYTKREIEAFNKQFKIKMAMLMQDL